MKTQRVTTTITAALCSTVILGHPSVAQEASDDPTWPTPGVELEPSATSKGVPSLVDTPTLSDYLAYAALNNPGLEAAFNLWKAALEKIVQAETLPDPNFTYAYFIEEVETRVGPQTSKFGITQVFPWFGKLKLRGDIAAEAAQVAFEQYQAEKLNLFFDVKKAYYEYYYLYRAISITHDNIELLKHFEGVARSKHRAGAPQSGVIKAQVELGKLDNRLKTFRDLRSPTVARLNAALNRPYDAMLPWPKEAPLHGARMVEETLFKQLTIANPELKSLATRIQKEELALALAKKEVYPDFMLGIDYISTDVARNSATQDSGKDPLIAKIALDIPIWRSKYKADVEEARRRHQAAEFERDEKTNLLHADLKMVLYRFRDADRKIDLYGDTLIPQAKQSLNVTEEAYRAGTVDFLNMIDAERLLLEFQLAHERALADREIALAEVEKFVGHPLGIQNNQARKQKP